MPRLRRRGRFLLKHTSLQSKAVDILFHPSSGLSPSLSLSLSVSFFFSLSLSLSLSFHSFCRAREEDSDEDTSEISDIEDSLSILQP